MRSPAAQVLETALALHRAPGERFRLRERPLPPGIVQAIEVAAGSPQAVHAAAAELGEPEPVIVEAARFYLEQVLFADPDADAYRVLGLASDATPDAIRTHHRWLQRWLHPDRAQAGDASIFATRVNQAFAQLRLPETRHAYDVRLAEARLAGAAAPLSPDTVRHWGHDEAAPRYGRRSRWLLAAALVACGVLVVLIARNPDHGAQWDPDEIADAAVTREATRPAIEDRDLGVLGAALSVAPAAEPPAESRGAQGPAAGVEHLPARAEPEPTAVAAPPANPLRALVAAALRPLHRPPEPGRRVVSAVSTVPATRHPTPAPQARAPAAQTQAPMPGAITSQQPPPQAAPAPAAVAAAPSAAPSSSATTTPPAAAPAPHQAAVATIRSEDAMLVAARLPLAEQRVAQLAGYLASRPEAVPLWDNVQAMTETNQARQRLNVRKGSKLELSGRAWRMRPEQASLSADYRCRSYSDGPCNGRLEVTLVWREGLWLVRGIVLGPAA